MNILVQVYGWMQWNFHLSIEIFCGLARCNAHFNLGSFARWHGFDLAKLRMRREYFNFELLVIDFLYKNLVS
jgi:hypothetical protein